VNLTLADLLPLVGRLDAAPGFDSPRERFRRFLLEHVTDVAAARTLIDECQRSVGEQRHRALQDLVVLLGRFLGFETIFGTYEAPANGVKVEGRWRSRGLLDVVIEIRTDQTTNVSTESLDHALASIANTRGEGPPRIGLAVVARHYAARVKLEHALAESGHASDVRVVSVKALLTLAAQVTANRLSHTEAVRLLQSGVALDFMIGLLERPATVDVPEGEAPLEIASAPHERRDPAFWVATILSNETVTAEQLLASVIAQRRVLGICQSGQMQNEGSPGDWVCFFLPGKGIVGHAQLASLVQSGASVVRNASELARVYHLAHVELYDEPVVQALRAGRPFALPKADRSLPGPCLSPIARQDFVALTEYRDDNAVAPWRPTIVGPRSA